MGSVHEEDIHMQQGRQACQAKQAKHIMCVGLVCVDIITMCSQYPEEDSDHRCLEQYWQRGGNASNSCTVLALLGEPCHYMGTLADSSELNFIQTDCNKYGIMTENCIVHKGPSTPITLAIVNQENGSRTLIHGKRNLPELQFEEFQKVDLSKFKWIHFEGRYAVDQIKLMILHVNEYNTKCDKKDQIIISVEFEKTKRELDQLHGLTDYVFIGKEHAKFHGYSSKEEAAEGFCKSCRKGATVICAWGEDGAAAMTKGGSPVISPAFPQSVVTDTLGAGDTFNGATIFALQRGKDIGEAITFGCKVAGTKVGMKGFDGLRGMFEE